MATTIILSEFIEFWMLNLYGIWYSDDKSDIIENLIVEYLK